MIPSRDVRDGSRGTCHFSRTRLDWSLLTRWDRDTPTGHDTGSREVPQERSWNPPKEVSNTTSHESTHESPWENHRHLEKETGRQKRGNETEYWGRWNRGVESRDRGVESLMWSELDPSDVVPDFWRSSVSRPCWHVEEILVVTP